MKKRKLTDADYSEGPNGFLISELSEGSGTPVATGDSVTVRAVSPEIHWLILD